MAFKVSRFEVVTSRNQRQAISRAFRQGDTATGDGILELEKLLCHLFGFQHALLTTNASLGLWLAFETSVHEFFSAPPLSTCNAVTSAIQNAGRSFAFRDFSPKNFLETRSGFAGSSATVRVPLFGRLEVVLNESAGEKIEDASQALMTRIDLKSDANVMVLSFYPTKFPGGVDGGAVLTNDPSRHQAMSDLIGRSGLALTPRRNWTLSNLNAMAVLAGLETAGAIKDSLLTHFQELSYEAEKVELSVLPVGPGEVPQRFILLPRSSEEAAELFTKFRKQGIEAAFELIDLRQTNLSQMASLGYLKVPIALSIPMYFGMSKKKLRLVKRAIRRVHKLDR